MTVRTTQIVLTVFPDMIYKRELLENDSGYGELVVNKMQGQGFPVQSKSFLQCREELVLVPRCSRFQIIRSRQV